MIDYNEALEQMYPGVTFSDEEKATIIEAIKATEADEAKSAIPEEDACPIDGGKLQMDFMQTIAKIQKSRQQ